MPEPEKPANTPPAAPRPHDTRVLDPRSLRGLAHPLRIRLLRSLRHHGPATASGLAERLGESSGATSYHLRQLAAHGFVEDDPTLGKGRERWWKAVQQGISWDDSLHHDPDPAVRGAADLLMHEVATNHTQELATWIATRHEWDPDWARASDMSDFTLRLPPAAARELGERLHALIEEYRHSPEAEAPDAVRVRLHLHAFPQHDA
ncbi:winged helix-turn-helix domain-containing protein [Streptomyces roseolus]|uniref:winged helix-turn-helix domain-containing protein n=1 Tax=Streptomyces roseolus TaxID=67358 RepID=UPI0016742852|nr:winged helix-turn-helix domain-containing protein [Streptomyces roseolus]